MGRSFRLGIIYSLLFVFGVLLVRNLIAHGMESSTVDCNEFGHIHAHASKSKDPKGANRDCHAGQFLFLYAIGPVETMGYLVVLPDIDFDLVGILKNHVPSPDLEPRRKPPRLI